ncbi:MAG TPA: hypothetical protein VFV38_15225 [Ktedonobacteraceae bacterium]|nr:hypothetical protein [Ktedonobacteraceae bacterium]
MDDKLACANGKGMYVADGQVVHGCRASNDPQAYHCGGRTIKLLHLITYVQLPCGDPASARQPRMLLGGMNRLPHHREVQTVEAVGLGRGGRSTRQDGLGVAIEVDGIQYQW